MNRLAFDVNAYCHFTFSGIHEPLFKLEFRINQYVEKNRDKILSQQHRGIGEVVALFHADFNKYIRATHESDGIYWCIDYGFPYKPKYTSIVPLTMDFIKYQTNRIFLGGVALCIPAESTNPLKKWTSDAIEILTNLNRMAERIEFRITHENLQPNHNFGDLTYYMPNGEAVFAFDCLANNFQAVVTKDFISYLNQISTIGKPRWQDNEGHAMSCQLETRPAVSESETLEDEFRTLHVTDCDDVLSVCDTVVDNEFFDNSASMIMGPEFARNSSTGDMKSTSKMQNVFCDQYEFPTSKMVETNQLKSILRKPFATSTSQGEIDSEKLSDKKNVPRRSMPQVQMPNGGSPTNSKNTKAKSPRQGKLAIDTTDSPVNSANKTQNSPTRGQSEMYFIRAGHTNKLNNLEVNLPRRPICEDSLPAGSPNSANAQKSERDNRSIGEPQKNTVKKTVSQESRNFTQFEKDLNNSTYFESQTSIERHSNDDDDDDDTFDNETEISLSMPALTSIKPRNPSISLSSDTMKTSTNGLSHTSSSLDQSVLPSTFAGHAAGVPNRQRLETLKLIVQDTTNVERNLFRRKIPVNRSS